MSATGIRDKRQIILPSEVSDAAGLKEGDQVDWRYEDGEIRGRKLVPQTEPRRVKAHLVKRGGALVFEAPGVRIEPEAIGQAVAEERESR